MDKTLEMAVTDEYGAQVYCECGTAIIATAWDADEAGWKVGAPYCPSCGKTQECASASDAGAEQ